MTKEKKSTTQTMVNQAQHRKLNTE